MGDLRSEIDRIYAIQKSATDPVVGIYPDARMGCNSIRNFKSDALDIFYQSVRIFLYNPVCLTSVFLIDFIRKILSNPILL